MTTRIQQPAVEPAACRSTPPSRITPRPLSTSSIERRFDQCRYVFNCARHPLLRGSRMRMGRGADVRLARAARLDVERGFRALRDLTLVVRGSLVIGRGMFCNRGVLIAAMGTVTIGADVRVGERVSIMDANHMLEPLDDLSTRLASYDVAPVVIGSRVLIGANCVILPGTTIGADVVVAAGSVVRGDIPSRSLVARSPAVVKRDLEPSIDPTSPMNQS